MTPPRPALPSPTASADPGDIAGLACPCGLAASYAACCGRWHTGPRHLQAPDAEALMRSRYAAYVQDRLDYLRDTWHPRTRPGSIEPNPEGLRWLGLEVRRHAAQDADHATVEFVARSKLGGRAHRLHETSRFVREDGRWYYVDGLAARDDFLANLAVFRRGVEATRTLLAIG